MQLGPLEIIALLLVAFSLAKLTIFLLSPTAWLGFARRLYARPEIASPVALLLAAIVLYFLLSAGLTIVQILAVFAFLALILAAGFARHAGDLIDWAMKRDPRTWLREQWLLSLIWLALLAWGLVAIFLS